MPFGRCSSDSKVAPGPTVGRISPSGDRRDVTAFVIAVRVARLPNSTSGGSRRNVDASRQTSGQRWWGRSPPGGGAGTKERGTGRADRFGSLGNIVRGWSGVGKALESQAAPPHDGWSRRQAGRGAAVSRRAPPRVTRGERATR